MKIFSRSLRAGWPAVVIAVVVYACFMHKAFNIDDVTFLKVAEHMLEDPVHPASVQIVMNGRPPAWISAGMWSGPVLPALLVPSVAMGGVEWLAHLMVVLVFIVGIFATAAFALRLGADDVAARWAALLLATSTAVIALAMTHMPDIPAMSFAVLGAERFLAFRDERRLTQASVAACSLALAVLSRQHAVLIFGCLVPLLFERWPASLRDLVTTLRRRTFWTPIAVLVVAAALVIAAYLIMRDPQHQSGITKAPFQVADKSLLNVNLANIPAQWVLSFPLGIVWCVLHRHRMMRSWWCWCGALLGVYLAWRTHIFHRHLDWMPWQAPVTALGTAVLVDILVEAVRRRDLVQLALGTWLLIVVPVAVYSHLPPKYFVPAAPAMAVLLMRNIPRGGSAWKRPLGVMCTIGLVLGVLVIRADQTHGEVGRRGGEVVASWVARGERVWFDGTWGFQWYAEQAGGRPVTTEDLPARGDVVVTGTENWVIKKWKNKRLLERYTFDEPGGRILLKPAGFFSNVAWGPLPWRWSSKPYTPIEVWRIE